MYTSKSCKCDYLTFCKWPEGGVRVDFPFRNMAGDTGKPFLGNV